MRIEIINEAIHEKSCLCHMISASVVCCMDSIISLLAIAEISRP